jgi:hypothetical protein
VTWFRPFLRIGLCWAIFSLGSLLSGLAALRLHSYPPLDLTPLRAPGIITLTRNVELVANVSITLWLAHRLRRSPAMTRLLMKTFFWTGIASCLFSAVSYPLDLAGIAQLGSYSSLHRWRGFYNEGGPYGLYLLAILLTGVTLRHLGWLTPRTYRLTQVLLVVSLLMTFSKAALFAAVLLVLFNVFLAASLTRRVLILGTAAAALFAVVTLLPVGPAIRAYQSSSARYEAASHLHPLDQSFVLGRVAGAFLVPRMLAAHPWTGIGWGNYPTQRNAPEFRGAAVWVDVSDDPGLGLWGMAPEVGLPLFGLVFLCLFLPFLYLRRLQAPPYLLNLALLQPIVHLAGSQLNLSYPWLVTCFALALAFKTAELPKTPSHRVPWSG